MTAYEKYIARLFTWIGFFCGVLITTGVFAGALALMEMFR